LTEKKVKRNKKDRKQRWAAIIAAVLAVAMALSAVAAYAGHLANRLNREPGEVEQELDSEAVRTYCLSEIERLKNYIEEYGPAAGVLSELCKNYSLLIQIEKTDDQVNEQTLQRYEADLKKFGRDLIELEPDNPEHRLRLLYIYKELGEDGEAIAEEIDALRKILHKKPDSYFILALIEFMKTSKQPEESVDEEIAWLKEHFENLSATAGLKSLDRYYYAVLLGNYLEEPGEAGKQLDLILDAESPESELYSAAENYRKMLQQKEEER